MLHVTIPGYKAIEIEHAVFDYNGTLATDGKLISGVSEGIKAFSDHLNFHVITADTFGKVKKEMEDTDMTLTIISKDNQARAKVDYVRTLGFDKTMAVGNGANDCDMLKKSQIGVAVLGDEGLAASSMASADIIVKNILDVFGFFRTPDRLVATLRR